MSAGTRVINENHGQNQEKPSTSRVGNCRIKGGKAARLQIRMNMDSTCFGNLGSR